MAEGFALADAFVRIRPDSGGFRAEATSQIKAATAGISPEIKVSANTNPAKASVAAFNAYARAVLHGQEIPVSANTAAAKAEVAALSAQLAVLTKKVWTTRMVVDAPGVQAQLGRIMGELRSLARTFTGQLTFEGIEQAQTELLGLEAQMERIFGRPEIMHIEVDEGDAKAQLAALLVQIYALTAQARQVKLSISDPRVVATVNDIIAALGTLKRDADSLDFGTVLAGQIVPLQERLGSLTQDLKTAMPAAINRTRQAWFGWAALANRIPLFGGLVAGIGLWHVLADAIIETAAVLIPAGIAFAAFAVAASSAVQTVINHIRAVQTVTEATGQAVKPFTNAFQAVSDAVTPHVYELFGQVMQIVNNRMGAFANLAGRAAQVVDMFGARIELAVTSSGFQKFLNNAISDLTTVGDIIGNLFGIFGNLIKSVAGVAQVLFHALLDITGAIEKLTSSHFVQVLGQWILGLHGFWVWAGLAASAVFGIIPLMARLTGGLSDATKAATGFTRLRSATLDLAGNTGVLNLRLSKLIPNIRDWGARMVVAGGAAENAGRGAKLLAFGTGVLTSIPVAAWAAAAGIALGALAFYLITSKTSTEQWFSALQASIDKTATWANVLGVITTGLAKENQFVKNTAASTKTLSNATTAAGIAYGKSAGGLAAAATKQADLTNSQKAFNREAGLTAFRLGDMARRFGGVTQSMGLARLAGIKVTDALHGQASAWKNDEEQVQGLIQGYKYMGVASGALGNSVKAVQLVADGQIQAVQNLNAAWTQFLGIVSGGNSTFVTFAQDMLSANKALAQTGGTNRTVVATFASTASATTRAANAARAARVSFNGLNAQSLQLRATWLTSISGAQTYYEALQTQSAAASDAARGSQLLSRAGGDLLRILAPAAKGSAILKQSIYALAQQFGFSRAQMDQFINHSGNLKKNEQDLQKVNLLLGASVSNVGKDWAAIATTLQGQVKNALAGVALGMSGARTAAQNLYTAIHKGNLAAAHTAYEQLATALHNAGLSWDQARAEADAFTKGLGGNLQAILASAGPRQGLQDDTVRQKILYGQVRAAVDTYTDSLRKNSSTSSAGNSARARLIGDLIGIGEKAGLSSGQIDKLIGRILHLNQTQLKLLMSGSGHFTITQVTSLSRPGGKLSGPQGAAAGMRVPGYGGGDRHIIAVEGGETIVPKHLTPAVAPLMAAHHVPGFDTGGFVGSGRFSGTPVAGTRWLGGQPDIFRQDMINTTESAMRTALTQAIRAAQSALTGFGGHGVVPSGPIQAYARRLVGAVWPGIGEWLAFADIVARESGWNPYATNPSSGAYGIPQALPASKMASAGADWRTDPYTQLRWMVGYIRSRWGDPIRADFNERIAHWYDNGGILNPGLTLAYNGTGRPERVLSPNEPIHIIIDFRPGAEGGLTAELLKVLRREVRFRGGGNVQLALGRP